MSKTITYRELASSSVTFTGLEKFYCSPVVPMEYVHSNGVLFNFGWGHNPICQKTSDQ